ncbi:MAG: DNA-binding response regulator, partial [Bacteroidetes bacterium HGW-Bacteroidetes-15]
MKNKDFKILLVDDEPDILEFVSYNLRKEGFSVHIADNGVDAIKLAEEIHPHLILLDVMMPEMDGI